MVLLASIPSLFQILFIFCRFTFTENCFDCLLIRKKNPNWSTIFFSLIMFRCLILEVRLLTIVKLAFKSLYSPSSFLTSPLPIHPCTVGNLAFPRRTDYREKRLQSLVNKTEISTASLICSEILGTSFNIYKVSLCHLSLGWLYFQMKKYKGNILKTIEWCIRVLISFYFHGFILKSSSRQTHCLYEFQLHNFLVADLGNSLFSLQFSFIICQLGVILMTSLKGPYENLNWVNSYEKSN